MMTRGEYLDFIIRVSRLETIIYKISHRISLSKDEEMMVNKILFGK